MLRKTLIYSHILCLLTFQPYSTFTQTHHALIGSRFAGSLGMYQNPASTLSSADTTDFSLTSVHFNNYTNFINLGFAPLLKKNPTFTLQPTTGDYPRELLANFNLNILSIKHKISEKTAVGFGMNLRSMINMNTSHYNLTDSSNDIFYFLDQNSNSLPFKGSGLSSTWVEYVLNVSHNVIDNRKILFNIGGNSRINRGVVGLAGSLGNFQYQKYDFLGVETYKITNADFLYAYPTTITSWDKNLRFKDNLNHLKSNMKTGASLDLGAELLIKNKKNADWFYEGLDYNYLWKLGISLVDIGFARYEYFKESTRTSGMQQDITPDILIDKFFGNVSNIEQFNDSLATVVGKFEALNGNFDIYHPTRLNFNIDHNFQSYIFLNLAASVPFSLFNQQTHYTLKDIAYFSLTPRIENRMLGVYLPISYNLKTKWHLGAALKAGPLMLGLNNLNIFNNNKNLQNTSAYFSLLIRWKKKVPKPNFDFIKSPRNVL